MTVAFGLSTIFAFLLVLARVAGFVAFLPVPVLRAAPPSARIALALSITVALLPAWPVLAGPVPSIAQLTLWVFLEAGFGLAAGLAVAFLMDGFQMAAHIIGLQAGYGFSTTIDPSSQADAGLLQVLFTLIGGLLFFALGLDREMIRILARSLERLPAGSWSTTRAGVDPLIALGGAMFTTGLRLALPVAAILLLVDLALALVGRMQQQLQLLSLAFPVKMLAALALLAGLAPLFPRIFSSSADHMLAVLRRMF
jgi:flagellar biosynthetic protein FliR